MLDYRRHYVLGGTYFFTVVTFGRRPLFAGEGARGHLRCAIASAREQFPFTIVAAVLLPDHLHMVWTLPEGDANYSGKWRRIKEGFTRAYLEAGGTEGDVSASRQRHWERAVWQRRFWEHTILDEVDLVRCVEYMHWNPVKHGLVQRVGAYPHSTFHLYVEQGHYPADWGASEVQDIAGAE